MLVDTLQSTPWVTRPQVSLVLNDRVSILSQHTCTSALTKVATAVAIVAVVTLHNKILTSRWSRTPGAAAPSWLRRGAAVEPDRVSVLSVPTSFYTSYSNTVRLRRRVLRRELQIRTRTYIIFPSRRRLVLHHNPVAAADDNIAKIIAPLHTHQEDVQMHAQVSDKETQHLENLRPAGRGTKDAGFLRWTDTHDAVKIRIGDSDGLLQCESFFPQRFPTTDNDNLSASSNQQAGV